MYIAYTGLVEDRTRMTAKQSFLLHYFLEKMDIQCADFCIQISLRMVLKFGDITQFLKILSSSGKVGL